MLLQYEETDYLKESSNIKSVDEFPEHLVLTSIDDIYDKVGYNWITFKNIFCTFSVLAIPGLHLTLFSNMIIPLKEFYIMTENQVAMSSSLLFLFAGIGSLFSGKLAGKFDRKLLINIILFFLVLFNLAMAFSKIWYIFSLFRCLIGLLIGLIVPISLNLLTEYLPLKMRSFVLSGIWAGFTFGILTLLFIMLYVMPNMESNKVENTIIISAILPFIAFVLNIFLLEDSPRNLMIRNREKEAFKILERIYNKKIGEKSKTNILHESQKSFQDLSFNISGIFNKKLRKLSLILTFVFLLLNMVLYGPFISSNLTMKALGKEDVSTNLGIIKNQIFITLANLLSLFLGGLMTESYYLGRKFSVIINQIFGLVFIFLIILLPNNFPVFFALYVSTQEIACNVITTYSCEVYPTKIRDHAIGFLFFCNRLGGFLSQILYLYFNSMGIWVPYYATAVFIAINIVLVFLLPYDSYGIALDKEISHNS